MLLGIIVILVVIVKLAFNKKEKENPEEDELTRFLEEWERENDALLNTLAQMHDDMNARLDHVHERVTQLERKMRELGHSATVMTEHHDDERNHDDAQSGSEERVDVAKQNDAEQHQHHWRHRYADIYDLAQSGLSIAEIARKTGRGNGEIQLILQLGQRGTKTYE